MSETFEANATFDPQADADAFLRSVPAAWVVYLLADARGKPVQLLTVKNLRAALKRRLIEGLDEETPTKRVNYRDLVRQVHWRRVDSRFEADAVYLALARALFPDTAHSLLRLDPAQFLHVDPAAAFPRFVRTTDLSLRNGIYLGPLEGKAAAAKLVEQIESAFDLCRYYNVLLGAPRAQACAYKEMGRCPAPCDGSITMGAYRQLLALAVHCLADPADAARQQDARMRQAAADLDFELAGRIKQYATELANLTTGPNRHVRKLADFRFLAIQPGPRRNTAKIFLITPARCDHVASMIAEPPPSAGLFRLILEALDDAALPTRAHPSPDAGHVDAGYISLVTSHLFANARQVPGILIPVAELDDKALTRGWRSVSVKETPDPTGDPADDLTTGPQSSPTPTPDSLPRDPGFR